MSAPMTDERAAALMDAMAVKEAADEGDPAAEILRSVATRAAHALRVKGMLVEALEAIEESFAVFPTGAVVTDAAPMVRAALAKVSAALAEARKEPT